MPAIPRRPGCSPPFASARRRAIVAGFAQVPGYRDEAEATEHLLGALQHPLRRELLRRYVDTTGPLNSRDLAHLLGEQLSDVSHHVRELESDLAIVLVKDDELHEASWWVRLSPEIAAALGLNPEEQVAAARKRFREQIAAGREDPESKARLARRLEEDREVLDRLGESRD